MTNRETLEAVINKLNSDGGMPQEQWKITLLTSIANSLTIIADALTEPQPKMGRWLDNKCSVCGKGIEDLIDSREWYENERPNYCPFCGVKLVDSQESED